MNYLNINQMRVKLGGRSSTTIYRDVYEKRLPHPIKMGRRNLWIEEEVDKAMKKIADQQRIANSGANIAPPTPPKLMGGIGQ